MEKLLILGLCLAACRSESENNHSSDQSIPDRPARPQQSQRPTTSHAEPLLKTERITLSSSGLAMVHSTIRSADQAEAVLKDLRSIPPSAARDSGIANVIRDLAKIDPQQARLLLEAWNDALIEKWLDAARNVSGALAQSDPKSAASFIEESVPRTAQSQIWAQFLSELPPADRVAYFDRIPEGSGKLAIAGDLVHAWLKEDPLTCARWLDKFGAGRSEDELEILYDAIRNSSTPSADTSQRLTALNTATDPEVRRLLANQLWDKAERSERAEAAQALTFLYSQEAENALAIAASLTPGNDLDRALSSLCHMAAFDGRVEEARKLIPLIQDPGQRKATISNVERSAAKPRR
jgi:hypothetical protein